jgi:uncharacterized protein
MPPRVRRWTWRIIRITLAVYLGLILVFSQLQESLIFPGAASQGRKDAIVRPSGRQELIQLKTKSGDHTVALFVPADEPSAPTVIFFYGNGMSLADTYTEIRIFHNLGCNILVPEYVGYGMATGKPSEKSFYETADAAYDHLMQRPEIDKQKILSAGWSIGAAVATDLASRRPVSGLITFSAFTSMPDIGSILAPYLPVRAICKHDFDNAKKFPTIQCPILCIHGAVDSMIPPEMTKTLAKSVNIEPIFIPGASHNDLFEIGESTFVPLLANFIHRTTR